MPFLNIDFNAAQIPLFAEEIAKEMNKEPKLPSRVKHVQGLYTKKNSDLFIDDLNSEELRQLANHREWYERIKKQ